jgi:hypothetical protein
MTRELIIRLRTCAAALSSGVPTSPLLHTDAAGLLQEAADALESVTEPASLGEPMTLLPTQTAPATPASPFEAIWGGTLPPATPVWGGDPLPCPACGDTTSSRTVRRDGRRLTLTCPVCSNTWEYARGASSQAHS